MTYRLIATIDGKVDAEIGVFDTRAEAVEEGKKVRDRGGKFVTIFGPLGKVSLEAYLT